MILRVGSGTVLRPRAWLGAVRGRRLALFSEPETFARHGRKVLAALKAAGSPAELFLLPRGEDAKTPEAVLAAARRLLKAGFSRDSAVLALGGGTVTDAAGFIAAIYQRGIPWISLPTTLLGQLDGGIGGKTGINMPEGKNLLGAFHQPCVIVCDTDFLRTLPRRELVSGLAEALKIGLTFDPPFWTWLGKNWERLAGGDEAALARAIRGAAGWKVKIVTRDERETKGPRELLNFGHTLGHALETASGHGALRHGEAVIWGMRAALRLSRRFAGLPAAQALAAEEFLAAIEVPRPAGLSLDRILAAAKKDKKARRGVLRFVLLRGIGRPVVRGGLPEKAVREVVRELL